MWLRHLERCGRYVLAPARWYGTSVEAELAVQSRALQSVADHLLQESGLLDVLRQVGEVRLTGSYAYGVMLDHADIDIEVTVPPGRERSCAITLLEKLIDQNYWNGYQFWDHREKRSPRHPDVPWAYYVQLKGAQGGHWWQVDVWVGDREALPPTDQWVRLGMDARAREIVLNLKHARAAGHIGASSLAIYTAVLKDHVASVDEFLAWQRESAPAGWTSPAPGHRSGNV